MIPQDPAAARGIARRTQSEIYRAGISGSRPRVPVDAAALERAARRALSAEAFAYIAGGAGAERTMRANTEAFGSHQIWPRPLRDVSVRDLSIDFLGRRRPTPLLRLSASWRWRITTPISRWRGPRHPSAFPTR